MDTFKMPTLITPQQRTSSITNAFTNGLMPQINPNTHEIDEVLSLFNQKRGKELKCVYCNDAATEWDHFHPLISNKKPTGYITEIYNLVPCCHACNGSKGSKDWKTYLKSTSKSSARTRLESKNLAHLIEPSGALYRNLIKFESWSNTKIHKIVFSYNEINNSVCKIEVFQGSKIVKVIGQDSIPADLALYFSTLNDINQSLINITKSVNVLRNEIKTYIYSVE